MMTKHPGWSDLYKTARCKFFTDDGRPTPPYCYNSTKCKYIHPDERAWDRAPPHGSRFKRRLSTAFSSNAHRSPRASSPAPARHRRASPLPEQAELFNREVGNRDERKPFERELGHERPVSRGRGGDGYGADYDDHGRGREPDRYGHRRFATGEHGPPRNVPSPEPRRVWHTNNENPSPQLMAAFESADADRTDGEPLLPTTASAFLRSLPFFGNVSARNVEATEELFKRMAMVSHKLISNTTALQEEERKLQAYTTLSETLSVVSPAAAGTIQSTLADIARRHAELKQAIDTDTAALEGAWNDILEANRRRFAEIMCAGMDNTRGELRQEKERTLKQIADAKEVALKHLAHVKDAVLKDIADAKAQALKVTSDAKEGARKAFADASDAAVADAVAAAKLAYRRPTPTAPYSFVEAEKREKERERERELEREREREKERAGEREKERERNREREREKERAGERERASVSVREWDRDKNRGRSHYRNDSRRIDRERHGVSRRSPSRHSTIRRDSREREREHKRRRGNSVYEDRDRDREHVKRAKVEERDTGAAHQVQSELADLRQRLEMQMKELMQVTKENAQLKSTIEGSGQGHGRARSGSPDGSPSRNPSPAPSNLRGWQDADRSR